jgi:SpoVK/Ycf46/Vps4 family AAA+-type ATPase
MMKKTLEGMKISPNNFSAIKEIFPNYVSLQTQIETINGIVNLIRQKKGITSTPKFSKITNSIDAIVGRHVVKDFIARLLYAFSKDYRSILNTFGSLALLGNAGMGKTALMKVVGYVLSKSGILVRKIFKIVSRKDLISQYLGSTAHHTRDLLMSSLEGVIGIDECHSLISDIKGDYGNESVSELVNFMDKFMGLTFVIISGYSNGMEKMFFDKNEGLTRRFKNTFILEKYTSKELTMILLRHLHHLGTTLTTYDANLVYSLITRSYCDGAFPNQAGDMLNLASTIHTNLLCNTSEIGISQVLLSILS